MPPTAATPPSNSSDTNKQIDDRIIWGMVAGFVCLVIVAGVVGTIMVANENNLNGVKLKYTAASQPFRFGGGPIARRYSGESMEGPPVVVNVELINKNGYAVFAGVVCRGGETSSLHVGPIAPHLSERRTMYVAGQFGGKFGETVVPRIEECELKSVTQSGPSTQTQPEAPAVQSVFDLRIPPNWRSFSREQLEQFSRQYTEQSKAIFQQYHGLLQGYDVLVPEVAGFISSGETVTLAAVLMRIPLQATDYIDAIYTRSREVFSWGLREGKIKKVISNDKTHLGAEPAVRSEILWANGEHHIVYTFHYNDWPSYAGTVLVVMQPGVSIERRAEVTQLLSELRLRRPHN
jgi:hypothetical protein